uniref:Uncharacterized protein n=1 Tax=Romanomermis culicivorax TaxID=13658 RepID=A0A915JBP2_ROMCU
MVNDHASFRIALGTRLIYSRPVIIVNPIILCILILQNTENNNNSTTFLMDSLPRTAKTVRHDDMLLLQLLQIFQKTLKMFFLHRKYIFDGTERQQLETFSLKILLQSEKATAILRKTTDANIQMN